MEEDVGECVVLGRIFLGGELPCRQICSRRDFPSYHEDGERMGCWVAHTALCILEALRVREGVTGVLGRRGLRWGTLLLALLLHDSGKLSKEYIEKGGSRIRHNSASAQLAYEVLVKLSERNLVDDIEVRVVSQACYLHMEYYMWRTMDRGGYASLSQQEQPISFELAVDVGRPLGNLRLILEQAGAWNDLFSSAISELSRIRRLRTSPSRYAISKSTRKDILLRTLALHWFILLFDNRAGSARGGLDNYWLTKLGDILRSATKTGAERVTELSDILVSHLHGRLTPLPRIISKHI